MSRWKEITAVSVVVLAVMGGIANTITISQFGFHLWEPITSSSKELNENPPDPLAVPNPTPTVSPTATPVTPLEKQLKLALSVDTYSVRDKALFLVAQNAVVLRDYRTAIRAASAAPTYSAQANSLAFVVGCAIEDGLYDLAAEAAGKVKTTSVRDRLKIKVIESRKKSTSDYKTRHEDVIVSLVDRESMTCFSSLSNMP